ncbi:hypothetical protein FB45DRAFT_940264 [Roridomyces roridus]|uniref:F-box domain-containing protein n=1 Tax=Roridomyces roridus TaxID=1738132 RepID=A0AAD7B7H7_9AGAR|nr:hypothetical protein FB45DRAFT_940264 [Roridomyces roridus]
MSNLKPSMDVRVPDELWLEMFVDLARSDLISLHAVSRTFHCISRPLVFNSFDFHPYAVSVSQIRQLPSNYTRVVEATARLLFWASRDIAPFVQRCTVRPWHRHTSDQNEDYAPCNDPERLLDTFFSLLPRFKNLRWATFAYVTFQSPRVSLLLSLQHLEDLCVEQCSMAAGDHLDPSVAIHIAKFQFLYSDPGPLIPTCGANRWLPLLEAEKLNHLTLSFDNGALAALQTAGPISFPNVHTLHIRVIEWQVIVYLPNFPNVRSLYIESYSDHPIPAGVERIVLTQLERYTGPVRLLVLFDPETSPKLLRILGCTDSLFLDTARNWVNSHRVTVLALTLECLEPGTLRVLLEYWTGLVKFRLAIQAGPGSYGEMERNLLTELAMLQVPQSLTHLFITSPVHMPESEAEKTEIISIARTAVSSLLLGRTNLGHLLILTFQREYQWLRFDGTEGVVESICQSGEDGWLRGIGRMDAAMAD